MGETTVNLSQLIYDWDSAVRKQKKCNEAVSQALLEISRYLTPILSHLEDDKRFLIFLDGRLFQVSVVDGYKWELRWLVEKAE
jgi:hypothetical protein